MLFLLEFWHVSKVIPYMGYITQFKLLQKRILESLTSFEIKFT